MPWEQEGIAPDIQAIAKGLGGGYQPIGAMLASCAHRRCHPRRFGRVPARPYLSGHPLACAAALEVQRVIDDEQLLDRVKTLGAQLERRLTERFGNHRMSATSGAAACSRPSNWSPIAPPARRSIRR
jgi:adenosylmethionine-8-amino-7-oxononanoate aminotransferase